jgi:hypothetical protein
MPLSNQLPGGWLIFAVSTPSPSSGPYPSVSPQRSIVARAMLQMRSSASGAAVGEPADQAKLSGGRKRVQRGRSLRVTDGAN